MSSFLVVAIKLSGFRDRIFSVLYPGLVLIEVRLFMPIFHVSVLSFLCLARFFGAHLVLGSMLWRSG